MLGFPLAVSAFIIFLKDDIGDFDVDPDMIQDMDVMIALDHWGVAKNYLELLGNEVGEDVEDAYARANKYRDATPMSMKRSLQHAAFHNDFATTILLSRILHMNQCLEKFKC